MEPAEVCRQLEELQGLRANAAAGERPGEDTPLGVTAEAARGRTRVGETAHTQHNEFLHNVEAQLKLLIVSAAVSSQHGDWDR